MSVQPIHLTDANGTVYLAEPAGAFDPPDDWEYDPDEHPKDWDRSGAFYDDEHRPDGCLPLYRLTLVEPNPQPEETTSG